MQSKPVAVFQILKAGAVLVSFNRRKNNNNKAPAVVLADNLEACSLSNWGFDDDSTKLDC